ncbi:hypothetical protein JAAARDRAFT_657647 [Jaapia argillacea MUCL 33604]|uniref:Peptidase A1 domain-containing protein n=1 Tax=Jaapia argillacea MUCL 33604 TaxID=933084 RepID=A0A067PWR6_9AGAM|nr:hypothetical protein JAAARDRAFT_657647 [Jaapia argillacea MUCL 33604]
MLSAYYFVVCLALVDFVFGLGNPPAPRWTRRQTNAVALPSASLLDTNSTAAGRSGILNVALSDDRQSYYIVIEAGDISFRVALDTASADLWITSSACTTTACHSIPKYPLSYQSPSFIPVNANSTPFSVGFADGTAASGFVARETIQFANLSVSNQPFGMVTSSNVTIGSEISGILGLGFPRLSTIFDSVPGATPFFTSLAELGMLAYPLFGLSLTRDSSGTLALGAVDSSIVTNTSRIVWNEVLAFSPFGTERNVSSYLQWVIPISDIYVNGTEVLPSPTYPFAASNMSLALLDVGTSGIYGPYQDVSRIFATMTGSRFVDYSGQWALPCATSEIMTFQFGGQNFTLQPSDYLIGATSGDPNMCLSWPRATAPSSDGIDWQLGTPFLRTVYTVFSYGINTKEPPMIGLYPLNNASALPETPAFISSFLSSASATIATALPNFVLATPTYTTPPYAFNTSIPASLGEIVSSDLALSTYSPLLERTANATGIPTVSPSPTRATLILTDPQGDVFTSISTASIPSVTLGVPPGWTSAGIMMDVPPLLSIALSCIAIWFFL